MRLLGSLAVFADVFFLLCPSILAQNDLRLPASFSVFGWGAGGFRFIPWALALARPFAFRPPFGFFPSDLCHAGLFAIIFSSLRGGCLQDWGRGVLLSWQQLWLQTFWQETASQISQATLVFLDPRSVSLPCDHQRGFVCPGTGTPPV